MRGSGGSASVAGSSALQTRVAAMMVAVALAVGGLLVLPPLVAPLPSASDLAAVRDPAKRIELEMSARKLQGDARGLVLQTVAGLVVLVGAIATWRQLTISRRQLFVAQDAQITERFTRAVDQLGDASVDVRTGGIYALERIARDSPSDRAAIAEILTAFVKVHSPWPPETTRPSGQLALETAQDGTAEALEPLRSRAPDVHAAMTVLGRRPRAARPAVGGSIHHTLSLGGVDLRFADLRGFDLEGAWLAKSNLSRAELEKANLRGASLWKADLRAALLIEADMTGADLREANLAEAWLHRAKLARVQIGDTDFSGAITEGASYDDT